MIGKIEMVEVPRPATRDECIEILFRAGLDRLNFDEVRAYALRPECRGREVIFFHEVALASDREGLSHIHVLLCDGTLVDASRLPVAAWSRGVWLAGKRFQ